MAVKECSVDGCKKSGRIDRYKNSVYVIYPNGYCLMHNARYKRHGSPEGWHKNWVRRPAIVDGSVARIPLGKNAKNGYAIVDADMAYLAEHDLWNKDSAGYASVSRRVSTRMHVMILGKAPDGYVIDHINRNKLDNRRINLRVCTQAQNTANRSLAKSYKNKYKGVYRHKNSITFYTRYKTADGWVYKGGFTSEADAAMFYNKKQREYFGEYVTLSEVPICM